MRERPRERERKRERERLRDREKERDRQRLRAIRKNQHKMMHQYNETPRFGAIYSTSSGLKTRFTTDAGSIAHGKLGEDKKIDGIMVDRRMAS